MNIVFDLDGTLADATHRLYFIQKQPKDWQGFFAACKEDAPIEPFVTICRNLCQDDDDRYRVEIWTGRSQEVEFETIRWLGDHIGYGWKDLKMRKVGDHRPDHVVKGEWFDKLTAKKRPDLAFEDRDQVVAMWRERGVKCCQVARGDF